MPSTWKATCAATGLVLLWGGGALAAEDHNAFLTDAIRGDMAETNAGELAQKKSKDEDVKDFGEMLVVDHHKHKIQASSLAVNKKATVPDEPSAEQKAEHDKLSSLSDEDFDHEFLTAMVADHKKEIEKYEQQTQSDDADIASFAKETLPVLRKHLETAEAALAKAGH